MRGVGLVVATMFAGALAGVAFLVVVLALAAVPVQPDLDAAISQARTQLEQARDRWWSGSTYEPRLP